MLIREKAPCPDCGRWNIAWSTYSCGCGFIGLGMAIYYEDLGGAYGFAYRWNDADDRQIVRRTCKVFARTGCEESLETLTAVFRKGTLEPWMQAVAVEIRRLGGMTDEDAAVEAAKLMDLKRDASGKKAKHAKKAAS